VTYTTPLLTYFCISSFVGPEINPCTKFEVSNFVRSRDLKGSENYKSTSRDVAHAPFVLLLHFWFVGQAMNPHTKLKVSGDTHSRDMEGIPKLKKIGHVTQDTLLLT